MEKFHIKPFASAVRNGAEMVMIAHLHCTCFEKDSIPTSLSRHAINYLRNTIGFSGVTISDDMIMKGVSDFGEVEACVMGIKAGLNMFIYRNSESVKIIEDVYKLALKDSELQEKIELSFEKIIKLKRNNLIIC